MPCSAMRRWPATIAKPAAGCVRRRKDGAQLAGVRLLPWTVTLLAVAPLAGVIADRVGQRPVVVTGLTLSVIGLAWLAAVARPYIPYALIIGPLLTSGVGNSAVFPAVQSAVVRRIGPDDIGTATCQPNDP
jgi:MFS family permease